MRTLSHGFSLFDLVHENAFTAAQTKAHSLTGAFAKEFDDLLAETTKTITRYVQLTVAVAVAEAKVIRADEALNGLVDELNQVLREVTDNQRRSPLYQRFFGDAKPSEVKRPILGTQLELMRDWQPTLNASPVPSLKALAAPLEIAIKDADTAVEAQRKAERELSDFNEIGECKALIDQVNAARKSTYGKLAELVHKKPEANLPSDFAEQFFLREARWSAPTAADLERGIARTEQQLARLKQQKQELKERQELMLKRQREAEAEALRSDLAAAQKRAAEEQARAAALSARLGELTPPAPPSP